MSEVCPCGSGSEYSLCCGPYLSGDSYPATPEALMRSRYSAYVKCDLAWLIATWHPSCRSPQLTTHIEQSFAETYWNGLNVTETTDSASADEGWVTFFATFTENNSKRAIYERSRFLREEQRWYYIDGVVPPLGRNDRCPCGSGKKYKKCCGQS